MFSEQLIADNRALIERNLITGTRYLNVEGMLPFENRIADSSTSGGAVATNFLFYKRASVSYRKRASYVVMEDRSGNGNWSTMWMRARRARRSRSGATTATIGRRAVLFDVTQVESIAHALDVLAEESSVEERRRHAERVKEEMPHQ